MNPTLKARVCRLDFWINPIFDELLAAQPQLASQVRRGQRAPRAGCVSAP